MPETATLCHTAKAESMWNNMTNDEQTVVRFGMYPHDKMIQAISEGYDTHDLAVAIMKIASSNGGVRA